jgi:hypothetical protein
VFVVVVLVHGVTMPVVDVVNMVPVRHCDMPATLAVRMAMCRMGFMPAGLALVVVIAVSPMQVPIMNIVDMIVMRHGHVPALLTMRMRVTAVLLMRRGHTSPPSGTTPNNPNRIVT